MKKSFLSISMVLMTVFCLNAESVAQLKSKICIVRESYFDETKKFCEEAADELNINGYPDYSELMEKSVGNTFGSGFIYVARDGRNYIVTNRHVVHRCEGAVVEFTKEDGSVQKFENLVVVATDEDLDIALLAFEKNERPFKTGLSFSATPAKDGDEVWSAGFPGLGNEPVWQFGKGNVTNGSVAIKEFVNPEITKLIQHSAPVDSGSSGGPLLVKKGERYEVVGVNTWKFFYRQSTNISLPSATIEGFISNAINGKKSNNSVESLSNRVADMKSLFEDENVLFRDLAKLISFDYVKKNGVQSFIKALRNSSSNDRAVVRSAYVNYSPLEGLSYASALKIYKELTKNDFIKNAEVGQPEKLDNDFYSIEIKTDDRTVNTKWIYESTGFTGFWRMSDIENSSDMKKSKKSSAKKSSSSENKTDTKSESKDSKKTKKSNTDISIETPYYLGFDFKMLPNVDPDASGKAFAIGVDVFTNDFFGVGFNFERNKIADEGLNAFGAGLNLQVPIRVGEWYLVPMGRGELKVGFYDSDFGFLKEIMGGLKICRRTESFGTIYFSAGYVQNSISIKRTSSYSGDIDIDNKGFFVGLGIGFGE